MKFTKKLKFSFNTKYVVKFLTICFIISLIFISGGVFAQDTGLEDTARGAGLAPATNVELTDVIANIIKFVLSFLGIVFLILVIYGGFLRMFAGGDSAKIEKSMKIIKDASIGLLIIFAAYTITYFVFSNVGEILN